MSGLEHVYAVCDGGCGHVFDKGNPACQEKPIIGRDGDPCGFTRCPDIMCRLKGEKKK